jgi:ABC-type branched-subunit amino acid transport system ATPase component
MVNGAPSLTGSGASLSISTPGELRLSGDVTAGGALSIAAGEQVAVIGPSGAGKTTLLQVMACALPPVAGRLTLDGQDPWALPRRALQALRGRLFLAPQVPPLPPRQRVVTSVLAGRLPAMGLTGVAPPEIPVPAPRETTGTARRASERTISRTCSSVSGSTAAMGVSRCWM